MTNDSRNTFAVDNHDFFNELDKISGSPADNESYDERTSVVDRNSSMHTIRYSEINANNSKDMPKFTTKFDLL